MMHGRYVPDNHRLDQAAAQRERAARELLTGLGAGRLDPRPWRPPPVPPSAVDLIQFFLWWSGRPDHGDDADRRAAAVAALELLPAARAELDQLEAGLLFTARGLDLTWAQTAQALGLHSPQAAQQRLDRLLSRQERRSAP
ncbi:DNA-binding protein [Jidongwangia harbinensis]|uniref:DNA-binding protein n=1 Tax=Jidongwangia harbinensis TaxID=2878561 RepID=UPI001CD9B7E3|nr:DNA-binding protein [Jidongwangia harbinensis]MCA2218205.1 DNA-binding protein [Jidongwangia harbinensis]